MLPTAPTRRAKPSEEGYILVGVMFLLALLIIGMAVAIPKIASDIQRDRELETYHRGLQYRRAIQLYYRKFNRYPPNVEALVKTNNLRFLRKKYKDPITGKDDWKPVMFGQNKAPLAMGFFGQPLGGAGFNGGVLAGTGPGGQNTLISTPITSGNFNQDGGGSNPIGNPNDPSSGANPTDPTGAAGSSPQPTGPTFGGAGIVGVSPASEKQSILVYKKKNHYNQWEFTYSPLSDMGLGGMMNQQQPLLPGQAPGTGGMNPPPGPGLGPGMGPGFNPTPTPPPPPQQ